MRFYTIFCLILTSLLLSQLPSFCQQRDLVLVIDPGHGGNDPGKPGCDHHAAHEKSLNLAIAQKLGKLLKQNIPQVKVVYTREKDVYISLEDRIKISERHQADFFISIHCNANNNVWKQGTETHIHKASEIESKNLAQYIEHSFKAFAGRESRGVMTVKDRKGRNLFLVKNLKIPSVLIECGFITNPTESRYLNSEKGKTETATAIYKGIRNYLLKENLINHKDQSSQYRVQVLASSKKLSLDSPYFNKLKNSYDLKIHKIKKGQNQFVYKYTVGNAKESSSAQKIKTNVRKLGFKDAFVVKI